VSSPSFALVHEYKGGRVPLFHLDLYRLDTPEEEVGALGIEEILAAGGVVLVEWGEKASAVSQARGDDHPVSRRRRGIAADRDPFRIDAAAAPRGDA
jgi:tRNA A37 threonylcarbamoyladenosine biosynthesis protein TsaE